MGYQEMGYMGSGTDATTAALAGAALAGNNNRSYNNGDMFGGNGILGLAALAMLGGGRGGLFGGRSGDGGEVVAGDVAAKVVELQNSSDLRGEVKSVESGIRESILTQAIASGEQFRGIGERIGHIATDAVKSGLEAKIASLESTNILSNKIGHVETEIQAVKCHVDNKIAASTQTILNQLNADKLDQKNEVIEELRSRNRLMEQNLLFGGKLNDIISQLNSVTGK